VGVVIMGRRYGVYYRFTKDKERFLKDFNNDLPSNVFSGGKHGDVCYARILERYNMDDPMYLSQTYPIWMKDHYCNYQNIFKNIEIECIQSKEVSFETPNSTYSYYDSSETGLSITNGDPTDIVLTWKIWVSQEYLGFPRVFLYKIIGCMLRQPSGGEQHINSYKEKPKDNFNQWLCDLNNNSNRGHNISDYKIKPEFFQRMDDISFLNRVIIVTPRERNDYDSGLTLQQNKNFFKFIERG
jgi:hypothetical protein